jgi:hypothetical protein
MEAHEHYKVAFIFILHTHHDIVYKIIVIMDNDSLTENIVKWNFVDVLEAGLIDITPKTLGGNKQKTKVNCHSLTHRFCNCRPQPLLPVHGWQALPLCVGTKIKKHAQYCRHRNIEATA